MNYLDDYYLEDSYDNNYLDDYYLEDSYNEDYYLDESTNTIYYEGKIIDYFKSKFGINDKNNKKNSKYNNKYNNKGNNGSKLKSFGKKALLGLGAVGAAGATGAVALGAGVHHSTKKQLAMTNKGEKLLDDMDKRCKESKEYESGCVYFRKVSRELNTDGILTELDRLGKLINRYATIEPDITGGSNVNEIVIKRNQDKKDMTLREHYKKFTSLKRQLEANLRTIEANLRNIEGKYQTDSNPDFIEGYKDSVKLYKAALGTYNYLSIV